MQFTISDRKQPRPHLSPFSHNTSVTYERQRDGRTTTHGIAVALKN